jgi:hypothetical protein
MVILVDQLLKRDALQGSAVFSRQSLAFLAQRHRGSSPIPRNQDALSPPRISNDGFVEVRSFPLLSGVGSRYRSLTFCRAIASTGQESMVVLT